MDNSPSLTQERFAFPHQVLNKLRALRLATLREAMFVASFAAITLLLRLVEIFRYRFNSDEPQHLHVVWAWLHGFIPYRDVFDNHMQLFQLLCAPILGVMGDAANDLLWMRLLLLPLSFVAAWSTYRIGSLLFSKRIAVWAALLVGIYKSYLLCSLEFRPDVLWATLWLLCILVIISGRILSLRRASIGGVLLGLCFGVSMKTTLLLFALSLAGLITATLNKDSRRSLGRVVAFVGVFLASAFVVPAIMAGAFALAGMWSQFWYSVFDHNLLPSTAKSHLNGLSVLLFAAVLTVLGSCAKIILRSASVHEVGLRRAFLFLLCGIYWTALYSFWHPVTRQDLLPVYPLTFILITAGLGPVSRFLSSRIGTPRQAAKWIPFPAVLWLGELFFLFASTSFWVNGAKEELDVVRNTLILTRPDDYVFDCKGETIFRRRCFYYAMETLTRKRIARGLIRDDVARRCLETKTCVAVIAGPISPRAAAFLNQSYLAVAGKVRVAGRFLAGEGTKPITFEVVIPASYDVISPQGEVAGTMDGAPYCGSRFLTAGMHNFTPVSNTPLMAILWTPAVEHKFTPFKNPRPVIPTDARLSRNS